jgi:hypothetical protein
MGDRVMVLYKYRSLQNFKRFVDILINRRLYAAPFLSLNDPMEGRYIFRDGAKSEAAIRRISSEDDLRIVSFSRKWNSTLMWSHYADRHRGVVVGIELSDSTYKALPMQYVSELLRPIGDNSVERTIAVLRQKHEFWQYEDEYRVILRNRKYIPVKIVEITLGLEVKTLTNDLIIDITHAIDPKIRVTRIQKRGLDVVL